MFRLFTRALRYGREKKIKRFEELLLSPIVVVDESQPAGVRVVEYSVADGWGKDADIVLPTILCRKDSLLNSS
jgi:hypothetical protein